jgi:hypothetical protein
MRLLSGVTNLADWKTRIRFGQAFPQPCGVQFKSTAIWGYELQVALHLLPYVRHILEGGIPMIAQKAYKVKVSNHWRPQYVEHFELWVEIIFEQLFVGPACFVPCLFIHCTVKVDWYCVHMVYRTDKKVKGISVKNTLYQLHRGWPDELRLEADQDMKLVAVDFAQPLCFHIEIIE